MLVQEIASFLATAGLGDIDHDLFMGARPDIPDVCTTVTERPSLPPLGTQENAIRLERPRLQVICRGAKNDWLTPRQQAEAIYRALATIRSISLDGTAYVAVVPSAPYVIGRDQNTRYLIGVNAEVIKEPSAS